MKVLITAHVSAGKFQFLIQLDPPLPMSVKCSCEIQSVSVEQVCTKVLASQNVFAAGLEQKSYFLAMPAHRRPQPTSIEPEEVFTCDVYCMVLDPESSEGMSRAKLVSEFQSAFDQLSHLSTGMVTPWISPAPKDSDRCSYDIKKGFDSCVTMSGTHKMYLYIWCHAILHEYNTYTCRSIYDILMAVNCISSPMMCIYIYMYMYRGILM